MQGIKSDHNRHLMITLYCIENKTSKTVYIYIYKITDFYNTAPQFLSDVYPLKYIFPLCKMSMYIKNVFMQLSTLLHCQRHS
jgi:hypothetical protein